MRDRGEPCPSIDHDHSRVGDVEAFGVRMPAPHLESARDRVVYGSGGLRAASAAAPRLPAAGDDVRFMSYDAGVEHAHDFEVRSRRSNHRRGEDGIGRRAHDDEIASRVSAQLTAVASLRIRRLSPRRFGLCGPLRPCRSLQPQTRARRELQLQPDRLQTHRKRGQSHDESHPCRAKRRAVRGGQLRIAPRCACSLPS